MIHLHDILLTIYFWSVTAIATIITFLICIICYPFITEKTFAHIFENVFGNIILYAMIIPRFWTIKITDLRDPQDQHFDKKYIIIANHASFIDTLIATQIPVTKKFIMAKVFTHIPIFGWLCGNAGHVPVSERDKRTTQSAIDLSVKAMKDGSSFMIYPEGGRSPNPYNILPFKTGAFRLAQRTGVPILPVAIKGTGTAMPIGGFCHISAIEIIIGKSFVVSKEYENIKEDPCIENSRKFIQKHLHSEKNKNE